MRNNSSLCREYTRAHTHMHIYIYIVLWAGHGHGCHTALFRVSDVDQEERTRGREAPPPSLNHSLLLPKGQPDEKSQK